MSEIKPTADIDNDLHVLSWSGIARTLTERRKLCAAVKLELNAARRELDRANAEIVRLRTDLIDMNDRRNKPKED